MRLTVGLVLAVALLVGCSGKQDLAVVAPQGIALPSAGRVLLVVPAADLERLFTYDLNLVTKETTDINEGKAVSDSAQLILSKIFGQVAINKPDSHPHFVARVQGSEKWDKNGGRYHVTCRFDIYNGTGDPLGIYAATVVPPARLGDFKDTLPQAYEDCLKVAADKFVASSEFRDSYNAGFPDPNPAAQKAYLRAIGFTVR